ncbi:MAG: WbuC family cupin fold metalloprotein [Bacillota bacterium]
MNNEVIFNTEDIIKINKDLIEKLKKIALENDRKRARINLHKTLDDLLHEMIIVHTKGAYVRPHKHSKKSESFHMIEGSLIFYLFNDNGKVIDKFTVGADKNSEYFSFRLSNNQWHSIVPVTDFVVFHEITNGPFTGVNDSIFPDWAPKEDQLDEIKEFLLLLEDNYDK